LRRSPQPGELMFRHPLVGRVLYAQTDSCRRAAAHRRAAVLLSRRGASATELAPHLEQSPAGPEFDDLPVLVEAARETLATEPAAAARWLRAALHRREGLPG